MNKLFSIFAYGLVAMVISLATTLQAAPNEKDPRWKVSTTKDWQGFISKSKGVKVADGHAIAQKREVSFTSKLKKFAKPAKLRDIELKQSVEWMNWKPYSIYNLNMKNAPVLISHGPMTIGLSLSTALPSSWWNGIKKRLKMPRTEKGSHHRLSGSLSKGS
jgi:hypothetical protein